jgi:hypothetical protein
LQGYSIKINQHMVAYTIFPDLETVGSFLQAVKPECIQLSCPDFLCIFGTNLWRLHQAGADIARIEARRQGACACGADQATHEKVGV